MEPQVMVAINKRQEWRIDMVVKAAKIIAGARISLPSFVKFVKP